MSQTFFISRKLFFAGSAFSISKPIVRIACIGVGISSTVMLISLAVLKGFKHEITTKITSFTEPVRITEYEFQENTNFTLKIDPELINNLLHVPGITGVSPFCESPGILELPEGIKGVQVIGLAPEEILRRTQAYLSESIDSLFDSGVIISQNIARKGQLKLGEKVFLFIPNEEGKLKPRKLKVAGIYKSGIDPVDNQMVFISIDLFRNIKKWSSKESRHLLANGYQINVASIENLNNVSEKIDATLHYRYNIQTIFARFPEVFSWLELMDNHVIVLLIIMTVIAVVSMCSTLLVLILEKTEMIGITKSLGATYNWLQKIFLWNAAYIIGLGLLLGNIMAISIVYLQNTFQWITLDEASYFIDHVPMRLFLWDAVGVNTGCMFMCILALAIPTLFISKIKPAAVLRFK